MSHDNLAMSFDNTVNQLTLGVSLKDEATFRNFYPGENSQLLQALSHTSTGKGEGIIYFSGGNGEGKTHLLQACCHDSNRQGLSSVYLPLSNLHEFTPDIFENLETLALVCVDDLQLIAGKAEWQEAFFHAYNRIRDAGQRLVISGSLPPKALGLTLPDLVSRLEWGIVFQLQSLSDEEKIAVLRMRAERRGMTLSEEVCKFILNHCPRHMSTLFAALEALDKASLAAQRKLTIPFVKTILQI